MSPIVRFPSAGPPYLGHMKTTGNLARVASTVAALILAALIALMLAGLMVAAGYAGGLA